jgi:hypothetical protein
VTVTSVALCCVISPLLLDEGRRAFDGNLNTVVTLDFHGFVSHSFESLNDFLVSFELHSVPSPERFVF